MFLSFNVFQNGSNVIMLLSPRQNYNQCAGILVFPTYRKCFCRQTTNAVVELFLRRCSMDIWGIVIALFVAWCIVTDIIYLLIKLTKLYICRDITTCKNRKCLVKESCKSYDQRLTKEEYNYLMNLLHDTFRKENTQNEKR